MTAAASAADYAPEVTPETTAKKQFDKGFLRNSRFIVVAVIVGAVAIAVIFSVMLKRVKDAQAPLPESSAVSVPTSGGNKGVEHPEYNQMLAKSNRDGSNEALATGSSHVPSFPATRERGAGKLEKPGDPPPTPPVEARREPPPYVPPGAGTEHAQARAQLDEARKKQMESLFATWANKGIYIVPPVAPMAKDEKPAATQQASAASAMAAKANLLEGGEIMPAIIETEIDTDKPSRVIAMIVGGALDGARLTGTATLANETVNVDFKTMSFNKKFYVVDAFAIEQDTMRSALSGDVNHKYLQRIGLPVLAAALNSYGQLATRQNQEVVMNASTATIVTQPTTDKQILQGAIGAGAAVIPNVIGSANAKPSVRLPAQHPVAIVFNAPVVEK